MLDVIAFIERRPFVLLSTICNQFPQYTRSEVTECMRKFADASYTHAFHFGRKGYPTRIENNTTRLARTKVALVPDNPADGEGIPAGELVGYMRLNSLGEYQVNWGDNFMTWAHESELEFKRDSV